MKLDHILVTTDLSPESLRILERIGELARANGARVTLLNVLHDMMIVPQADAMTPSMGAVDIESHLKSARTALEGAKGALGAEVDVKLEALSGSSIADTVADYAGENEVDLIALSTHGRTGFRHLVLGSVAEAIMRHAHCPVLCFPPDERAGS